jgi:hypothetical protein
MPTAAWTDTEILLADPMRDTDISTNKTYTVTCIFSKSVHDHYVPEIVIQSIGKIEVNAFCLFFSIDTSHALVASNRMGTTQDHK